MRREKSSAVCSFASIKAVISIRLPFKLYGAAVVMCVAALEIGRASCRERV